MTQASSYDVIVIGGGPAGYVGAIRAAQLGLTVACVEKDQLGGICLNWGCIPTKALLAAAEIYDTLRHDASNWGIVTDNVRHDWQKVISRSRSVVGNLTRGVASLFKKNKVVHIQGHAKIAGLEIQSSTAQGGQSTRQVIVTNANGQTTHTLKAQHVVIATGALPRMLPGTPFDGDRVIGAKEAMSLPEQPKKLLIVGAGAIGMEFAYFYNAFGTQVTVIEMMDACCRSRIMMYLEPSPRLTASRALTVVRPRKPFQSTRPICRSN